jgi:GntR family transcriptional regulator, arabinose operon transcriptional repressor
MSKNAIQSDSPTPIRSQLKELLLQEIRNGRFKPGCRIPSERKIAERYGISRASVRESISELLNSGLLFRTVGKGTFVSPTPTPAPPEKLVSTGPHNIAFIISESIFHFVQTGYNKILAGVQDVSTAQGWRLLFHTVGDDANNPALDSLRSTPNRSLDGCVVVGGVRRHVVDLLQEEGVPTVLVDLLISDEEAATVTIDYALGARLAMRHLYELGHRDIGYVGFSGSEKYRGYWQCLEELGLRYDPRYVEFLHELNIQPGILAGFQAIQRMIAARSLPSALLVTNDFAALGVMEGLAIAGLRTPDQISIVGFDDLGQKTSPPLTTVRVDLTQVGRLAANALLRRMTSQVVDPERTVVPVELLIRGTTGSVGTPAIQR